MISFALMKDHFDCYMYTELEENKVGHRETSQGATALVWKRWYFGLER